MASKKSGTKEREGSFDEAESQEEVGKLAGRPTSAR